MTEWTKNQIMMLIGLLFSFIALILSSANLYYYIKLSHEQTIVIQQVDEIQSKIGNFEKIFVSNIHFKTNNSICWNKDCTIFEFSNGTCKIERNFISGNNITMC